MRPLGFRYCHTSCRTDLIGLPPSIQTRSGARDILGRQSGALPSKTVTFFTPKRSQLRRIKLATSSSLSMAIIGLLGHNKPISTGIVPVPAPISQKTPPSPNLKAEIINNLTSRLLKGIPGKRSNNSSGIPGVLYNQVMGNQLLRSFTTKHYYINLSKFLY
ncbi:unknown protein [Microcystis aeruginosa NIES-843]|uniref:Uncharacterized protein n=1 Tax=Microcystis aeruginosa (strain NIES-843 / IAM M-2473) TaxID=449447 RepID=B0JGU0_MICAN|nr:unknown protein [Microcystis aeruginosa NIES-843]